tara:strand:- start:1238 stop:1471 length:234 start_codon:yes stop_codon:yes gene_type:complete
MDLSGTTDAENELKKLEEESNQIVNEYNEQAFLQNERKSRLLEIKGEIKGIKRFLPDKPIQDVEVGAPEGFNEDIEN